ncbi:hypothetical protein [Microbacterium sp. No. 7]|uniref:hypothetical protein n=1 Tax=Microbacterium sp. No. 7 TaxID=1714373 RepID=UPI0006CFED1B|nr:hypothetical protein [Microbacterium sp. No. 7]ALJ19626.1 hypothetical protein AOA12_06775 [Microbacterium sp. No. 7]
MTVSEFASPRSIRGIVGVWVVAVVAALALGVLAPVELRAVWLSLGFAGCVVIAFVVQLMGGRAEGFIQRVAASVLGALLAMGLIGLGFGLSSMVGV